MRVAAEVFFRHRSLFWVVVTAMVVLTAVATLLTPKQYQSEMKLLVQNARENVVLSAERTTAPAVVSGVSEEQVNSELEILHSHDVIDPVADPEWQRLAAKDRTADAIRQHERMLQSFEKRFGTEIVRKTNVIAVRLSADSPEKAKDELERLSAAYLAERRHLQRPAGSSGFFASEAERVRNEWNEANEQLVGFQQQHELISLTDREADINDQISKDEEDLLTTDAALKEMDARLGESTRQLHDLPSRQITEDKVVPNLQSVEELNTLLVQLKNSRTQLLTKYQPTERLVQEVDAQISTTEAALDEATRIASHEKSTNVDPAWQQVHTEYVQAEITRQATGEHRAKVESQMAGLRQQLATLQGYTVQFNNLQTKADQLKDNYDLYAEKRDQAQLEDAMDNQNLTNVAVAEQPTLPYAPDKPKVVLNMLLGAVTAMFLGFCCIYFADASRATVSTPRELSRMTRYPVLATLPLRPDLSSAVSWSEFRAHEEFLTPGSGD